VALAVGSVLGDAGINWRVGFAVSMVVGLSALAVLPRRLPDAAAEGGRSSGFLKRALRRAAPWRLMLLFIAANGITIIVSTWLIEYLVVHLGNHAWYAGVLGFVLFAVTAAVRELSGRFAEAGPGAQRLAAVSPLLTAAGLVGWPSMPTPCPPCCG
jgi:predicted MFS family arabinose efflux permease